MTRYVVESHNKQTKKTQTITNKERIQGFLNRAKDQADGAVAPKDFKTATWSVDSAGVVETDYDLTRIKDKAGLISPSTDIVVSFKKAPETSGGARKKTARKTRKPKRKHSRRVQ